MRSRNTHHISLPCLIPQGVVVDPSETADPPTPTPGINQLDGLQSLIITNRCDGVVSRHSSGGAINLSALQLKKLACCLQANDDRMSVSKFTLDLINPVWVYNKPVIDPKIYRTRALFIGWSRTTLFRVRELAY
jgi:hypothetical protein